MNTLCICLAVFFALAAAVFAAKWLNLRRAVREINDQLSEKLSDDTNTLISVSSGDPAVCALAADFNVRLKALRNERHRLDLGDAELNAAITGIAHDIRTPLTAMSGYLDLLECEALSDDAHRYLAVIRERCRAMKQLTEELLSYSILSTESHTLCRTPLDLRSALERSVASFYAALKNAGIEPEISMPEDAVMRSLDSSALERILGNILGNAVKYSDGDLRISLDGDGCFEFSNEAQSLNSLDAARLFDRFYTVDDVRGSTGLGLSIAKLLTERMDGSIRAEYSGGRLRILLQFRQ